MSAVAEEFIDNSKIKPLIARSRPGRADLRHPLANRIMTLRENGRTLINGPSAYRSAEFAEWHKQTADLFASLPPEFEDRFYQRSFGRVHGVLTDDQIHAAFKADMTATVEDLQRIFATLQKKQRMSHQSAATKDRPLTIPTEFFTPKTLTIAAAVTVLLLTAISAILLA